MSDRDQEIKGMAITGRISSTTDGYASGACVSEPKGKAALRMRIQNHLCKADALQAIYNSLPEKLSDSASAGLDELLRGE